MNKVLLSALIPIVALIGWTGSLEFHARSGTQITVRIQGYDPRDLLTGHYIRYSLNLGQVACEGGSASEETCVCMRDDGSGFFQADGATRCDTERPSCRPYLRGHCEWTRFTAGVERYSIPESLAPALATIPADSWALLSVTADGKAQVLQLFVGKETIEDFARRAATTPAGPIPPRS